MRRTIGSVLGAVAAATVIAGCVYDPYYGHRRYGSGYNSPYGRSYDYSYNDRYRDDDHRDRRKHRPDDGYDLPKIVCASQDGRPNRCRTELPIKRAEVDKRYSSSPCEYGRSWGYDGHEIWVDRGCRARFVVVPAGRWR
jgi:hypothetical protein